MAEMIELPDVIVEAFALGPMGDFVELTFTEPNLYTNPAIQHAHHIRADIVDVEAEVLEVQEALAALVDKILLLDRKPSQTTRSRRA